MDRRESIICAALTVFLRDGVGEARLTNILKEANCSNGSFYHFFPDKTELAAAIYIESWSDIASEISSSLDSQPKAEQGVKGVVTKLLDWATANPDKMRFLLICRTPSVAAASAERMSLERTKVLETILTWLGPHLDRGRILPLSPDLLQALWIGPALNYIGTWLEGGTLDPDYLQSQKQVLSEAAWRALAR